MGLGTERNKPCSCGSGRKFKFCCQGRKPVQHAITFDFGEPKEVKSVTINGMGQVRLNTSDGAKPVLVLHERLRARSKGPKTITRIPAHPMDVKIGNTLDALCKYKTMYFIDTNTQDAGGSKISAACIMLCSVEMPDEGRYVVRYAPACAFEIHNCFEKPENFAISILQSMLQSGPGFQRSDRFAIVNDSDLGNHNSFNAGQLPIYGDIYLSSNIDLVYASADTGNDILNIIMRKCDKWATRAIAGAIAAGLKNSAAKKVKNGPCSRFQMHSTTLSCPLPLNWQKLGQIIPLEPDSES